MMIQPTEEESKLYDSLENAKSKEEKAEIIKKIKECIKERDEALKDCPFVH